MIALGRPGVKPPAEVLAVILAERWGVLPSAILDCDFGDVLKWWSLLNELHTEKGGHRGSTITG